MLGYGSPRCVAGYGPQIGCGCPGFGCPQYNYGPGFGLGNDGNSSGNWGVGSPTVFISWIPIPIPDLGGDIGGPSVLSLPKAMVVMGGLGPLIVNLHY
ncbi:unnamed protein product [Camellia sinensis]